MVTTISFVNRSLPITSNKIIKNINIPYKGFIVNNKSVDSTRNFQSVYGNYSNYAYGEYSLSNIYGNYGKDVSPKDSDKEDLINTDKINFNKIKTKIFNVIKMIIKNFND